MRIVVDTNCLLVSIPKVSESRWLFNAILTGTIELAVTTVTTDILQEYEETIGSFYNSPTLAANVLETLMNRPNVIKISPYYFWTLITNDPDDNKFVDCAIACGSDYLITEDGHFNSLKFNEFPRIQIRSRKQFKEIVDAATL